MNISVEESVALIETLGEKAIFGEQAGTALRNILLKMGSIDVLPEKALKQLEAYGVNTAIVKDTTLSFEERLTELSKIAKDSTAIMQVFGTENATAATVLLNSLDTYDKMTEAVTGTNTAVDQAAINSDTLSGVIGELRAAWENLVIKWSEGTDVAGTLKNVIRFLTENLESIVKVVFTALKAWAAYRLTLMAWNKEGTGVIQTLVGMVKNIPNVISGVKV
ncbi:MAG: phage tail tape measure protein [Bacteroidetes bacterium]|nr:phage tail tape measure protein [Bacteroidota bacterium]